MAATAGHQVDQDQDQVQKRIFTNWINAQLAKHPTPSVVRDLFQDLCDGHQLLDLLEVLSGHQLDHERKRNDPAHWRSNVDTALRFLTTQSVKLVNINVPDVVAGKPTVILGLVWSIILHFQMERLTLGLPRDPSERHLVPDVTPSPTGTPPLKRGRFQWQWGGSTRQALLHWAQDKARGTPVPIRDFGVSWRDGRAFAALMNSLHPGVLPPTQLQPSSPTHTLNIIFTTAENILGIPRLLEPHDLTVENPDEKSIMTYVSQFLGLSRQLPAGVHVTEEALGAPWAEGREHPEVQANVRQDFEDARREMEGCIEGAVSFLQDQGSPQQLLAKHQETIQRFESGVLQRFLDSTHHMQTLLTPDSSLMAADQQEDLCRKWTAGVFGDIEQSVVTWGESGPVSRVGGGRGVREELALTAPWEAAAPEAGRSAAQEEEALSLSARQLNEALETAGILADGQSGHALSCWDLVEPLGCAAEDAGLQGGQQERMVQEELHARQSRLVGSLRDIGERAGAVPLTEATLPAVQARLGSLVELELDVQREAKELQGLREQADRLLGSSLAGEAQERLREAEEVWGVTAGEIQDRKDQCFVIMAFLREFRSHKKDLRSTIGKGERLIQQHASYMGKERLGQLLTEIEEVKCEFGTKQEQLDGLRKICQHLHSELRPFVDTGSLPFQREVDELVDRWLDVTEWLQSYGCSLQQALRLWDELRECGCSGWAARRRLVPPGEEAVLEDQIHGQEQQNWSFLEKAVRIQELLRWEEVPLELQVMESAARGELEQMKHCRRQLMDQGGGTAQGPETTPGSQGGADHPQVEEHQDRQVGVDMGVRDEQLPMASGDEQEELWDSDDEEVTPTAEEFPQIHSLERSGALEPREGQQRWTLDGTEEIPPLPMDTEWSRERVDITEQVSGPWSEARPPEEWRDLLPRERWGQELPGPVEVLAPLGPETSREVVPPVGDRDLQRQRSWVPEMKERHSLDQLPGEREEVSGENGGIEDWLRHVTAQRGARVSGSDGASESEPEGDWEAPSARREAAAESSSSSAERRNPPTAEVDPGVLQTSGTVEHTEEKDGQVDVDMGVRDEQLPMASGDEQEELWNSDDEEVTPTAEEFPQVMAAVNMACTPSLPHSQTGEQRHEALGAPWAEGREHPEVQANVRQDFEDARREMEGCIEGAVSFLQDQGSPQQLLAKHQRPQERSRVASWRADQQEDLCRKWTLVQADISAHVQWLREVERRTSSVVPREAGSPARPGAQSDRSALTLPQAGVFGDIEQSVVTWGESGPVSRVGGGRGVREELALTAPWEAAAPEAGEPLWMVGYREQRRTGPAEGSGGPVWDVTSLSPVPSAMEKEIAVDGAAGREQGAGTVSQGPPTPAVIRPAGTGSPGVVEDLSSQFGEDATMNKPSKGHHPALGEHQRDKDRHIPYGSAQLPAPGDTPFLSGDWDGQRAPSPESLGWRELLPVARALPEQMSQSRRYPGQEMVLPPPAGEDGTGTPGVSSEGQWGAEAAGDQGEDITTTTTGERRQELRQEAALAVGEARRAVGWAEGQLTRGVDTKVPGGWHDLPVAVRLGKAGGRVNRAAEASVAREVEGLGAGRGPEPLTPTEQVYPGETAREESQEQGAGISLAGPLRPWQSHSLAPKEHGEDQEPSLGPGSEDGGESDQGEGRHPLAWSSVPEYGWPSGRSAPPANIPEIQREQVGEASGEVLPSLWTTTICQDNQGVRDDIGETPADPWKATTCQDNEEVVDNIGEESPDPHLAIVGQGNDEVGDNVGEKLPDLWAPTMGHGNKGIRDDVTEIPTDPCKAGMGQDNKGVRSHVDEILPDTWNATMSPGNKGVGDNVGKIPPDPWKATTYQGHQDIRDVGETSSDPWKATMSQDNDGVGHNIGETPPSLWETTTGQGHQGARDLIPGTVSLYRRDMELDINPQRAVILASEMGMEVMDGSSEKLGGERPVQSVGLVPWSRHTPECSQPPRESPDTGHVTHHPARDDSGTPAVTAEQAAWAEVTSGLSLPSTETMGGPEKAGIDPDVEHSAREELEQFEGAPQHSRSAALEEEALSLSARQLNEALETAGILADGQSGHALSCWDLVEPLGCAAEDAGLQGGQQERMVQEELHARQSRLVGSLRDIGERAGAVPLTEATLPAVQARLGSLVELELDVQREAKELQGLREQADRLLGSSLAGEAQERLREAEEVWGVTAGEIQDRKDQCFVIMAFLREFRSHKKDLRSTIGKGERLIQQHASYMGKERLGQLLTEIEEVKCEFGTKQEQLDGLRKICQHLHSELRPFVDTGSLPFQREVDELVDRWLDVTEWLQSYGCSLQQALRLWDELRECGCSGWAARRRLVPPGEEAVLEDQIHGQEQQNWSFLEKAVRIQELLRWEEVPLELQVMESAARGELEQMKHRRRQLMDQGGGTAQGPETTPGSQGGADHPQVEEHQDRQVGVDMGVRDEQLPMTSGVEQEELWDSDDEEVTPTAEEFPQIHSLERSGALEPREGQQRWTLDGTEEIPPLPMDTEWSRERVDITGQVSGPWSEARPPEEWRDLLPRERWGQELPGPLEVEVLGPVGLETSRKVVPPVGDRDLQHQRSWVPEMKERHSLDQLPGEREEVSGENGGIEDWLRHVTAQRGARVSGSDGASESEPEGDWEAPSARREAAAESSSSSAERRSPPTAEVDPGVLQTPGTVEHTEEKGGRSEELSDRIRETAGRVRDIEKMLQHRSQNVSEAKEQQKRVWGELDRWHAVLSRLDAEVQDLAEVDPCLAQQLMDALMDSFQEHQQAARTAEQRTTLVNKIPDCLEDYRQVTESATAWIQSTQAQLSDTIDCTNGKSLGKQLFTLQVIADTNGQKQAALQEVGTRLREVGEMFDTDHMVSRVEQLFEIGASLQQAVSQKAAEVEYIATEIGAIESEVKTIESKLAKVNSILTAVDIEDLTAEEHLTNRQIVAENLVEMRKVAGVLSSYEHSLALPEWATGTVQAFARLPLITGQLAELQQLTSRQSGLLESLLEKLQECDTETERLQELQAGNMEDQQERLAVVHEQRARLVRDAQKALNEVTATLTDGQRSPPAHSEQPREPESPQPATLPGKLTSLQEQDEDECEETMEPPEECHPSAPPQPPHAEPQQSVVGLDVCWERAAAVERELASAGERLGAGVWSAAMHHNLQDSLLQSQTALTEIEEHLVCLTGTGLEQGGPELEALSQRLGSLRGSLTQLRARLEMGKPTAEELSQLCPTREMAQQTQMMWPPDQPCAPDDGRIPAEAPTRDVYRPVVGTPADPVLGPTLQRQILDCWQQLQQETQGLQKLLEDSLQQGPEPQVFVTAREPSCVSRPAPDVEELSMWMAQLREQGQSAALLAGQTEGLTRQDAGLRLEEAVQRTAVRISEWVAAAEQTLGHCSLGPCEEAPRQLDTLQVWTAALDGVHREMAEQLLVLGQADIFSCALAGGTLSTLHSNVQLLLRHCSLVSDSLRPRAEQLTSCQERLGQLQVTVSQRQAEVQQRLLESAACDTDQHLQWLEQTTVDLDSLDVELLSLRDGATRCDLEPHWLRRVEQLEEALDDTMGLVGEQQAELAHSLVMGRLYQGLMQGTASLVELRQERLGPGDRLPTGTLADLRTHLHSHKLFYRGLEDLMIRAEQISRNVPERIVAERRVGRLELESRHKELQSQALRHGVHAETTLQCWAELEMELEVLEEMLAALSSQLSDPRVGGETARESSEGETECLHTCQRHEE
ncbi:calmin [Amblyraja radiata]|uniref:calmin n=1 Tax=Amblyraja radiata TaxID=386614 RepID=UPI0014034BDA|nr:calmin [Amblyraja radiata]